MSYSITIKNAIANKKKSHFTLIVKLRQITFKIPVQNDKQTECQKLHLSKQMSLKLPLSQVAQMR